MANYIDKNILCEAYIHLDRDLSDLDESEIQKITEILETFAKKRSAVFLYAGTEVEVQLKDGSIKAYLEVAGTISAAIAIYPNLREGIKSLYSDAKRMSEFMVSEVMYVFRSKSKQTIRFEARVGVIGSVHKIVLKLESLERSPGRNDLKPLIRLLESARFDILKLMKVLKNVSDRHYLRKGFLEIANSIPKNPRKPLKGSYLDQDALIYTKRRDDLIKSIEATIGKT